MIKHTFDIFHHTYLLPLRNKTRRISRYFLPILLFLINLCFT
ncbi:hypothetical protein LSO2F_190024 [Candidatus Liberibacter solanacearum]